MVQMVRLRRIKYLQLNCHESENLYLTDEVLLELGHTWETAKAKILADAHKYGNKAEQLISSISGDRQNGDFKQVINELASILDTKQVFWPVRVGKLLGKHRPHGQIAQFLGRDICGAFWNMNDETQTRDS